MSDENNILVNGGFEATTADEAANSVDHGNWYTADAIEGWSATEGSIEIQSRSFGPTDATGILSSGAVLELDSHDYRSNCWFGRRDNADSTVAQSFTLDTDGTFELGFSYAARATTKTSDFSVSILDASGAVVFFQEFSGHEGNLEVAWQRFTQDLKLSAGDYTLAFSSAEYADRDTIGALIDNVSFIDTGPKAQDDAYTLDLGVSEILNVEATVGTDTRDVTVLDEDFSGERHLTRLETIADSDLVGKNGAAFSNSRADGVLLFNTVDVSMLDTGTLSFTIETDGKNRSGFEAADSRYGDYVRVEISVDGGEFILLDMFEVRQQDLGLRGDQQTFVGSLTGQTFTSQSSALSYALPVGATSVQLRFITELSSSDEIIKFDDVLIQGEESFETGYATGLLSNDTDGNGEALEIISAEGTGLFSYADEDVTVLEENFDDAGRHLDDLDTVEESNLRGRNGVAQATSRGDGELEFAEVDIAGLGGETFSFSLNADALGCNRFESYGWARDFVKVEARFDDGSYQTIDTFDVEWRSGQQIFVGRNSGQEVAVSDGFVNLSYDLSALAGDAATAQIRLIAEVSSSGEIFEVDDVSLVGTRSVRSGAGIATITLESGAIVTIKSDGSFSYNANGKFAYLAEDEATSDSFSYTVQDASGNTDTATVTINLVGTNEGVVIVSADTVAGVTELADGDGAVLSDTGTIVFSDVDLIDVHTVTVTQETAYDSLLGDVAARGALTAVVSDPATGDGTGAVTWTFQVDNSAIEDLGENRTITQAYSVTIDDQQGSTVTRTIVVTITGVGVGSLVFGDDDTAIDTGDGENSVTTGSGDDAVTVGDGDNTVDAGDGTNTIAAGGGSNTITAGTGNDTVTAGDGGNTVDAGEGDNSVTTGSGDDSVTVGDGANTIDAGDGTNTVQAGDGNNDVTTGSGDDSVTVGDGTNSVDAGDGTNTVAAGDGSNTITTGTGNDAVMAGDGGNTVDAGEGDNSVTTGSGDDSVTVGDGANTIDAGDGTNTVQAGDGNNDVITGSGDDSVTVGDGTNSVDAGDGTNTVAAGGGSNTITTGTGNDTVTAG
ncbi:MAG: calcium-binding protein, partial [Hoeflea sp.]|nr:calcium-binding protein [Hoeflea sp.]